MIFPHSCPHRYFTPNYTFAFAFVILKVINSEIIFFRFALISVSMVFWWNRKQLHHKLNSFQIIFWYVMLKIWWYAHRVLSLSMPLDILTWDIAETIFKRRGYMKQFLFPTPPILFLHFALCPSLGGGHNWKTPNISMNAELPGMLGELNALHIPIARHHQTRRVFHGFLPLGTLFMCAACTEWPLRWTHERTRFSLLSP